MKEKLIYNNPLQSLKDVENWIKEGEVKISFEDGLVLENGAPESLGDHAHWTYWLPEEFPENILINWEFFPLREPGLCMMFFGAIGRNGESIFSDKLSQRDGYYPQYHSGEINAYHISYFRHKFESERAFRTCNLRKSHGFHFVTQGGDPLPPTEDANDFYRMSIRKEKNLIQFTINELLIFSWEDDGQEFGPVLGAGNIGFRQMAPMKAKYRNLQIYELMEELDDTIKVD